MLVTLLGTVLFPLLTFTPMGELIGPTALPPVYFIFLAAAVFFYLLWVTLAKRLSLIHISPTVLLEPMNRVRGIIGKCTVSRLVTRNEKVGRYGRWAGHHTGNSEQIR